MEECQNIDYKRCWNDEYLKWICGFSNAQLKKPEFKEEMGGLSIYVFRKGNIVQSLNGTVNDGVNDGVKISKTERRILQEIFTDGNITYTQMQIVLNLSEPTIRRAIKHFKQLDIISRYGSDKDGRWIVTDKGKEMINNGGKR
jgi:predicted HTH transcriptional regulator